MISGIINILHRFYHELGSTILFSFDVFTKIFTLDINWKETFKQAKRIGYDSLPIAMLVSFFVGLVLALQTGFQLLHYGLEGILGSIVGLSLVKELGPVMIAILVVARSVSSMAAEIGTMIVSEEIDALRSMGIDPVTYLAVPRVIATTSILPVLNMYALLIGFFGGAVMAKAYTGVAMHDFFDTLFSTLSWQDLVTCIIKSFFFGLSTSLVGCREGFQCSYSPEGVGIVTTRAVVVSFVIILIADYYLTRILLIIF